MLDSVTVSVPQWSALFLPEFDGHTRDIASHDSNNFVFRHYLGEGSFSMAWAVSPSILHHLRIIDWWGRLGCIVSQKPHHPQLSLPCSLFVVGIHGGQGNTLNECLTDVVTLVRRKPRDSKL